MVWSLSKDDDGLESVHPPTNQGATLSSPSGRLPASNPKRSVRPQNTAASVFVDPSSQVPDARDSFPSRHTVETTVVLKGRKLDEMRAAVAQQKLSYQRKKQRALFVWAAAGGAALALGWFAGILLSQKSSTEHSGSENLASQSGSESLAEEGTVVQRRAEGEPEELGVLREPSGAAQLEELPLDEPAEGAAINSAEGEDAAQEDESSDTSSQSADDTFTLDDLPVE